MLPSGQCAKLSPIAVRLDKLVESRELLSGRVVAACLHRLSVKDIETSNPIRVGEMLNPTNSSGYESGDWQIVGNSTDVGEKQGVELLVGTEVIAIFRQEGTLYAVDGICAHQGGPIAKGALDKNCVTCPWHGWQYNIGTGENLLTKRKMLRTFEIREIEGRIEVKVALQKN